MKDTVKVTCPHCDSSLVIDVQAGVVIDHAAPVRTHDKIDFDTRLWSIPGERTKNSQPHLVPLSDAAIEILQGLAGQSNSTGQGLVFTTTGSTPPSGFSRAKARLDGLSGVKDWRLHDLRRTVVSHMADMGVDPLVADRILNHVASSTMGVVQRTYQRSNMLPQRRDALERWAIKLGDSEA